jgi:hypothetical protein
MTKVSRKLLLRIKTYDPGQKKNINLLEENWFIRSAILLIHGAQLM